MEVTVLLEELLKEIHGFTKDSIVVTEAEPIDAPGPRIVFVNRAFEEATGYSRDEVIGKSPRLLQGPDTCPATLSRIRTALERWQPIQEEVLNYRKDGSSFWIDLSIVPVADKTGWFRFWVAVQRDISAKKLFETKLAEQRDAYRRSALVDELTGLFNRRGLKEAAALSSSRGGETVSLFAIDLDRFKQLNDTLGHEAGDAVLKAVADRLRAEAKPGDLFARMGGDEFILLDTATSRADPLRRAMRIEKALSRPVPRGRTSLSCHASVGVATGSWEDYRSGLLFRRADLALYAAKAKGRGQAVAFAPEMERRFLDRMSLAADLQLALETGGLSVAYMPKVHAPTGQVLGLEALARWHHPVHGDVSPAAFIPLAEDLKIVENIDAFVLNKVAQDRQDHEEAGLSIPPISINVSARRLNDNRFVEDVERLGLSGEEISVELVETVLLDRIDDQTLDTLDRLRWRGIGIEIDDFGSGHASILSLTQIRPDWLKLDRRFAQGMVKDQSARDIVRSTLGMARALNIRVIAEGVESDDQAALLASFGCDALQGFLFGKPGSLEDALKPTSAVSFPRARLVG